ncbi:TetR/AcrR family transcriptional regulator [Myroides odoratus]|uniref:TetR/AcrR family transcriptional regulator n=1 Tax=Myroides odoratus TaxID=256 RepID=UPI0039AED0B7
MREKISQIALGLFIRDGLKRTTMDQLALELGISKKTIYQFFASKEALIEACVTEVNTLVLLHLDFIKERNFSAIKELFELKYYIEILIKFSFSSVVTEYSRFYTKIEAKQKKFLLKKIGPYIEGNIQKGMNEGVYKSDSDSEFCTWSFLSLISSKFSFVYEADYETLREHTMEFYLQAIATEKGNQEFKVCRDNYFNENSLGDLVRVI